MSEAMPRTANTPKQNRMLRTIALFIKSSGYAPTFRELGDALGISREAALYMADALERQGLLRRVRGVARSIELVGVQS